MIDATDNQNQDLLIKILGDYRHIAVIGLSAKRNRPSHGVSDYMQSVGYDIIPINPLYAGQQILGKRVYASLAAAKEAGEQIEIVDVFRRAEYTQPFVEEAVTAGAKAFWLQLGIRNEATKQDALAAGLFYVQDRCIKVEHARFFSGTELL